MFLPIILVVTTIFSVRSVPVEPQNTTEAATTTKPSQNYDYSQFDEVYDQRQNGTENYRVNVNKVVLVWTPPGNLITAAMLLDPSLYEEDEDSEEFFKPEGHKPNSTADAVAAGKANKRKRRIPGYLRPFVRRHHNRK